MISIFNGRKRGLGESPQVDIHLQVSVRLRKHLHLFKGARLAVFMSIALRSEKDGWAEVDTGMIRRDTHYNRDTISRAIADLCRLVVNDARVLLSDQTRGARGRFDKNRYLLFPTPEEILVYEPLEGADLAVSPCIGFPDTVGPGTVEPDTVNPAPTIRRTSQRENLSEGKPTHTGEGVCVPPEGSAHSLEICLRYAEHLQKAGQGIRNPAGLAKSIFRSGDSDAAISGWLASQSAPPNEQRPTMPGRPDRDLLDGFLGGMQRKVDDTTYRTWFAPIGRLHVDGSRILLAVPNRIFRDWLDANYSPLIQQVMLAVGSRNGEALERVELWMEGE
jgi:hypothetical protein